MLEDADGAGRSAADAFLDPVAVVEVHARLARALMDLGRYDEAGAVFALLADAVPQLPRGPRATSTRSALTSTRVVGAQAGRAPAPAPALPATRLADGRPATPGQGERAPADPAEPAEASAPLAAPRPPAPPIARPTETAADLAEAVRQVARLAAAGPEALSARLPVEDERGSGSGTGSGASTRSPRRGAPPASA